MRFLHTADWHVGKTLNGFSLLGDQQENFAQIEQIARDNQVDAVVNAGDLYDRSVPSEAAVKELNGMLKKLNLVDQLPVLAISGNHDSAPRLGTGAEWFRQSSFYLSTTLAQAFTPVVVKDTQFFLLPFFGIQAVRNYFSDDSIKTVNDAMNRIVEKMQEAFAPDKHHVLVAHFFAAGSQRTADSETLIEVGGLSAVSTATLAPFDYVALGHLHNRNALKEERIKYSGSPLKFSVSEARQEKGVWIVDTNPFGIKWVPLPAVHEIVLLKGNFKDLLTNSTGCSVDDYYDIDLTNQERIPDALNQLRTVYPKIVSLHRTHQAQRLSPNHDQHRTRESPMDLLTDFYSRTMGTDLTAAQQKWAKETLLEINKED